MHSRQSPSITHKIFGQFKKNRFSFFSVAAYTAAWIILQHTSIEFHWKLCATLFFNFSSIYSNEIHWTQFIACGQKTKWIKRVFYAKPAALWQASMCNVRKMVSSFVRTHIHWAESAHCIAYERSNINTWNNDDDDAAAIAEIFECLLNKILTSP